MPDLHPAERAVRTEKRKQILTMNIHTITTDVGTNPMTFETGKIAKLADGAVTVRCGDTIILVTAVSSTKVKPGHLVPTFRGI